MIYVTHDQIEAMTLGQRIVVLDDGVIQQIDKPMNLYARPANRFVAGFIGSPSMNFLRGRVQCDGRRARLVDESSQALDLGATSTELLGLDGREVDIGLRPEDLRPQEPAQD